MTTVGPLHPITAILCPFCHRSNAPLATCCAACGRDLILNNRSGEASSSSSSSSSSDDRRYVITRILKVGGQGSVYAGVDQHHHPYAIKEMLDYFRDPDEYADALERFNAEAELLKRLDHPRIPRVFSHFTDEGRHYLTMDLVQGEDLEQRVAREGAIPEAQVLVWADQISDVLAYLHGQQLIYRDVKPSNIMIETDGNVKLVDFGIARLFVPHQPGTQIGTPGYAPPEQYQGMATPVSDIYALAATLHHLLTGRDPTEHPPFSFPPARDVNVQVSRRTSEVIQKALRMQPEERYQTVAEFRAMLRPPRGTPPPPLKMASPEQTVVLPASAPAPQPSPSPRPAAPCQRRCVRCVTWVAALLLIGGGVIIGLAMLLRGGHGNLPNLPTPAAVNVWFETEVEVVVDGRADDTAIRAAFLDAYAAEIQRIYGKDAGFNKNISPFVATDQGTNWEEVGRESGEQAEEAAGEAAEMIRYRARMRAFVQ